MVLHSIEMLEPILDTMNLPDSRKLVTTINARWLLRNIRANNSNHPDIETAVELLKRIVREGRIQ